MHHLLHECFRKYPELGQNLSQAERDEYTTVLNREEALGCLSRVAELRFYGDGKPEHTCIFADGKGTRLLVLRPTRDEISTFLAGTGNRLRVLELFLTAAAELKLPVLRGLTDLNLSNNQWLEKLSVPEALPILETLNLSNTAVASLEDFPLPATLTELFLDNTKLDAIPDELQDLKELVQLDLRSLALKDIPEWFPYFHLVDIPNALQLHNTRVRGKLIEARPPFGPSLRSALRTLCGPGMREYKVVLLGDAEAGKTLTLHRLLNDPPPRADESDNDPFTDDTLYAPPGFDHNSTPGVLIEEKKFDLNPYNLGDETIRVHFWDFGGQDILHSAHRAFLTGRTLYVILLNTRNNTQDARARYWLRYLRAQQPDCPVLLVLNKIDQNRNASIDLGSLRRKYGENIRSVHLSALKYNAHLFSGRFTRELLTTLIRSENLTFHIPSRYNKVRAWIRKVCKESDTNYIEQADFRKKCEECDGIFRRYENSNDSNHRDSEILLQQFADLGLCVLFSKILPHIILRPKWITNAIYTILIQKHSTVTDGLISEAEIKQVLYPDRSAGQGNRTADADGKCDALQPRYVMDAMNSAGLSFPVPKTDLLFVPMLCKRGIPTLDKDYFDNSRVMRFRYILDDLPGPALFELLMELFKDAAQRKIWLTGGEFLWESGRCSALVTAEDHCLDVYIHPDGTREEAMAQLRDLRRIIDTVLKGHIVSRMIGLRVAAETEFFDYDLLNNSRDYVKTVHSRCKSGRVYVEDILSYCDNSDERLRLRLLDDIVAACRQMQEDCHYYKCSEDTRTLYLSNALINRGYHTTMNHLSGYGKELRRSGEIDLRIDSLENTPMSICEALILRSRGQKDYWFQHLDKLVGRYNQGGYPYVFLVSYVEDTGQNFDGIYEKYCEHIRNCPPRDYGLRELPVFDPVNHPAALGNIKIAESRYHTMTRDVLVYHIFVRFWNTAKKRPIRAPRPGKGLKPRMRKKRKSGLSPAPAIGV